MTQNNHHVSSWRRYSSLAVVTVISLHSVAGFAPPCQYEITRGHHQRLAASDDSNVDDALARARKLLEKTKAKLAAQENEGKESADGDKPNVPFFATAKKAEVSRDGVIKSRDESTGLILADGEKMAAVSEQEEWEMRSLLEVFESEIDDKDDIYSLASKQLAQTDVAASIFDLRKTLQMEDYRKIFDKRNLFIGEDN